MKFLFLEPFFGGSHRNFAEGLAAHSNHEITLVTMPARFWKWRMRGAALHFLKKLSACNPGEQLEDYDGLITTDLMSLSDFRAIAGRRSPPALVYFHENQMTYPLAPGEQTDFQFGFTDITTALAAEQVVFNSHTHFKAFFESLPKFLNMMPEYHPKWVIKAIRDKSCVIYPGCQFTVRKTPLTPLSDDSPPLIIWNHRWEFDKAPEDFFAALDAILEQGLQFRLALLGENFQMVPKAFLRARERYGERIIQYGYLESREEYLSVLKQGHIVISTANQENFGISVVEAIRLGCMPLLPNRLSYPEIVPEVFHKEVLYENHTDLVEKLTLLLTSYSRFSETREKLSETMGRFAWENLINRYDEEMESLVTRLADH